LVFIVLILLTMIRRFAPILIFTVAAESSRSERELQLGFFDTKPG
jgi:hypothetical protein